MSSHKGNKPGHRSLRLVARDPAPGVPHNGHGAHPAREPVEAPDADVYSIAERFNRFGAIVQQLSQLSSVRSEMHENLLRSLAKEAIILYPACRNADERTAVMSTLMSLLAAYVETAGFGTGALLRIVEWTLAGIGPMATATEEADTDLDARVEAAIEEDAIPYKDISPERPSLARLFDVNRIADEEEEN